MSDEIQLQQLTLFAEGSPARTSPLPESGRAWLESDQDFGSSSTEFLRSLGPSGLLSKTSLAFYPATREPTSLSSFKGWSNSGMASPGGFLTLSISEWPSDAAVCSLSEVLETDVAPRYFLSAKACSGILRRAERRGKELPEMLRQALTQVAGEPSEQEKAEDKTRWLQYQEEYRRLPMTWRCHDCGHLWETPGITSDQELREATCPECKSDDLMIE